MHSSVFKPALHLCLCSSFSLCPCPYHCLYRIVSLFPKPLSLSQSLSLRCHGPYTYATTDKTCSIESKEKANSFYACISLLCAYACLCACVCSQLTLTSKSVRRNWKNCRKKFIKSIETCDKRPKRSSNNNSLVSSSSSSSTSRAAQLGSAASQQLNELWMQCLNHQCLAALSPVSLSAGPQLQWQWLVSSRRDRSSSSSSSSDSSINDNAIIIWKATCIVVCFFLLSFSRIAAQSDSRGTSTRDQGEESNLHAIRFLIKAF